MTAEILRQTCATSCRTSTTTRLSRIVLPQNLDANLSSFDFEAIAQCRLREQGYGLILKHKTFLILHSICFPNYQLIAIWRLSLEPRVVELTYSGAGFGQKCEYGDSYNIPTALITCKGSRSAVIESYPLCFGSILHPEAARFSFEIDTLYFDCRLKNYIGHFFGLLKDRELRNQIPCN